MPRQVIFCPLCGAARNSGTCEACRRKRELDIIRWSSGAGPLPDGRCIEDPATPSTSSETIPEQEKPAAKPKALRTVRRGSLDMEAVTELKRNPALTNKQLAEIFGCNPGTLRDKKKCPMLAQARAILKAQRQNFQCGSIWRGHPPDDDEA